MNYMTIIDPVLENSLAGTADEACWRDLLRAEGLPIMVQQGRARIMVSVVDSTYNGVRFQELSVSVQMDERRFFLAQAYNSLAAFAFVERTLFRAPYDHGAISIQPRQVTLRVGALTAFEATLSAAAHPVDVGVECNELQVYLPKRLHKRSPRLHYFHARLEGQTDVYRDGITVRAFASVPSHPVWEMLQGSDFQVQEWRVRATARHSKSKTYQEPRQTVS